MYIAGTNTSVSRVEVSSPPISTTATETSSSEPSSRPLPIGSRAAITDTVVITIGRSRVGPAFSRASLRL